MIRVLLDDLRTTPWLAFSVLSWLAFDAYAVAAASGWVPCW